MDTKIQEQPTVLDTVKLAGAAALLLGALAAYYVFADLSVVLRAIALLVAALLAGWVALTSFRGQVLWKFMQASRVELRKVAWPTREETIQTTITVFVFAVIMGLFFSLLDWGLLQLIGSLTGREG